MEKDYKAIKAGLLESFKTYFKVYRNHIKTFPSQNTIPIEIWCFRVIDLLPIIKYLSLSESNLLEAYSYYSQLLACLTSTKPINELENLIKSIELQIIRCLVTPLDILEDIFNEAYEKAVNQCEKDHDKYSLISVTLYYILGFENQNFKLLWDDCLKKLFDICFHIENNDFIKDYAIEILLGPVNKNDLSDRIINKEKIHILLDNIFQKSSRFKYFLKASQVFDKLKRHPPIQEQDMRNANLKIKVVKAPRGIVGFQVEEHKITINDNSPGHKSKFFTIGSHELANIRLKIATYYIENICFAIYYNGQNFFMIDCSKCNYSQTKMKPKVPYKIENNYLIDLALAGILRIIEYKIIDNVAKDRNELELKYEYLTGPLSQSYTESREHLQKLVKTHKKEDNADSIIFGRGGQGFHIDESSDLLGYTGKQHINFFLNNDQEFCALDMGTKNGSFLLLKNNDEVNTSKWSKVFPLFRNFLSFDSENLLPDFYKEQIIICQYIFEFEAEKISDY